MMAVLAVAQMTFSGCEGVAGAGVHRAADRLTFKMEHDLADAQQRSCKKTLNPWVAPPLPDASQASTSSQIPLLQNTTLTTALFYGTSEGN